MFIKMIFLGLSKCDEVKFFSIEIFVLSEENKKPLLVLTEVFGYFEKVDYNLKFVVAVPCTLHVWLVTGFLA